MSKTLALFLLNICQFLLLTSSIIALSTRTISFENADISVNIKTASGEWLAEAFNATSIATDPQLIQWVSLGVPRLIAKGDSENVTEGSEPSPFKFVPGGFYISVETLSAEIARELAQRASLKYKARIEASQFLPLNKHLDTFGCYLKLFDVEQNAFVKLAGSAVDLSNPATIFFETANASKYEHVLREREAPLLIQCTVESYRKECTQSTQTCWMREQDRPEPAFTERFTLSTNVLRVEALLERSLQSAKQEFISSVLAAIDERLHAVNQSLSSFQTIEKTYAKKFSCAFGLIDSTANFLLEANLSACVGFTKQTSRSSHNGCSASCTVCTVRTVCTGGSCLLQRGGA